jgi:Protein of unknown function (DUF4065)
MRQGRETERRVQFDRAKLKAVILYACARCDVSKLGAVKLHKVLYYADMLHYAHLGNPITGATYRKRALGPTCDQLLPTLRELARERSIEIRDADYFGYRKKEYVPLADPEVERFTKAEIALLSDVIDFVCFNNTAKTISEYSHNRAWELAEFGDVLPYHSVFHLFPTQVSPEAMEWASQEVNKIEAEKSDNEAVGGKVFRNLRDRVLEARGK